MNKIIVTTTINPPTEAIQKFDFMKGWTLVVAGDKKTQKDYCLDNGIYLSPEKQEKMYPKLSELIGWNCIQRRNIGFVYAYKELKADLIATIDDDNIPMNDWGEDILLNKEIKVMTVDTKEGIFDPIYSANPKNKHLWHRGFPVQLLKKRHINSFTSKNNTFDIQANFWNGSPDIDAICRIATEGMQVSFDDGMFPFTGNGFSPFNSQNTILTRKAIPHYFMFPFIGRMDDIWASYYIESLGFKVVYDKPTVFQERNEHDLVKDLEDEMLGYRLNQDLIHSLRKNPESISYFLPHRSVFAFEEYKKVLEEK